MVCTITSFPRRLRVLSALMTSSSLSGDFLSSLTSATFSVTESFFQRAVTPSQRELISHHFHQHCSHRILGRISDSQTRPSPFLGQSNHYFACCWHCSFFRGSLGPIPGCFSFVGPWVLVRGCFPLFTSIWYVFHQTFSCCLALDFASHVTRLCFSSWSAGCVLRRRLLMSGSPCTPILGFGSRVSLVLACFFSLDCDVLVVIAHLVLHSRCSVGDFSSVLFLQLLLAVVYSGAACGWSLQHCCVVYSATT